LQKTRKVDWKETLKIIILSSLAWGAGYCLIWGTKWVLVDLIYNKGLIKTALEQFQYRSKGEEACTYWDTIYRNMYLLIGLPAIYLIFMIIEGIVEFVISKIKKVKIKQNLAKALPYAIIILMPYAWYFVLKSHSYNHVFFTHRDLLLLCTGLPILLQKLFEKENEIKQIEEKK